jgi:hypothetical protein
VRLWYGQKEIRLSDLGDCPIFSSGDLASLMGVTPQRVRQWFKDGMPRVARGKYPLIGCIRWHARYARECRSKRRRSRQKERYLRLRLKLLEVQLQEITGDFVERELVCGRKYLIRALSPRFSWGPSPRAQADQRPNTSSP